jgi:hypothetical protein
MVDAMHEEIDLSTDNLELGALARPLVAGGAVVGVLGLALSALLGFLDDGGWSRFLHSYLVAFAFFLSLSLGALFFIGIWHVTHSGWCVVVRRVAEAIAMNVVPMAVLAIPIALGLGALYPWTDAEVIAHSPLVAKKIGFLNPTFFVIRLAVYFTVWSGLAFYYFTRSVRQDTTGDVGLTHKLQWLGGPGTALFALTTAGAGFDLLMSLEPEWFSTMFGVYYFAGAMVGFYALLILVVFGLQWSGRMRAAVSIEHYHDMGKLAFGFVVFWAYIAFSQFMLYWYANLPEETHWYMMRTEAGWLLPSVFLILGHFVLPFLGMMSRSVKRNRILLAMAACWLLFAHWVDLYWVVMPSVNSLRVPFNLMDLTAMVGIGGLYVAMLAVWLNGRSLVPVKDPRLAESLAFENV